MKLARAVQLRAELQAKLDALNDQLRRVGTPRGERPAADPVQLVAEARETMRTLERLFAAIRRADRQHTIETGESLATALTRRELLVKHHRLVRAVAENSARRAVPCGRKEFEQQAKDLAVEIRDLDAAIQQANQNVEVML
jgi:hypothetical protein